VEVISTLAGISPQEWNRLAGDDPFLRHEFLSALHETGCAVPATGWTPQYLALRERGHLTAAMPLYIKTHSYGEYVFDWAWADAYARHGLHYYPKLLAAVPFTPVTGSRLIAETDEQREVLIRAALKLARDAEVSSLHCLFPPCEQAQAMHARGMMLRHTVQFHWANAGYEDFEHFLSSMSHDKRKKVKQERRRVHDAGIAYRWVEGADITPEDMKLVARCYRQTYRMHGSTPYLNAEFFQRIGRTMAPHLVLVIGERAGKPIAASFNVRSGRRLCGRYWGTLEYHSGLHFETCYYQTIEYCIARGIDVFEGGSRGEHKLARGLAPVHTYSAHWLAHPEFAAAVDDFLARETRGIAHYIDELNDRSPFKDAREK
jgi:predicted N-acyltransferase